MQASELNLTNTGVWVINREHVVVPTVVDEYVEERRRHALVFHWLGEDWAQQTLDDYLCGVCGIDGEPVNVFSVGVNGNVYVAAVPGAKHVEQVDDSDRGPNYSETLRATRVIGNQVFAAGMARQVYRRQQSGAWYAIDQGTYLPRGQRKEAVGFLDLDGHNTKSICGVGYKGEIWMFDGSWRQEASPTNVALTRAIPLMSGEFVLVGLSGTIIRGGAGQWEVLEHGITSDNFWGGMQFREKVFVATASQLFVVTESELQPVDTGQGDATFSFLHAADGVLWSVGAKDILRTFDGENWERVPNP